MKVQMLIAGFGGQGILFAGKIVAYVGLLAKQQVTWLPSYGPEMRGGTANCSVCIDEHPIGCPMVLQPDVFLAMNAPSFERFLPKVLTGGRVIYDSSLIPTPHMRDDLACYGIPATALAAEHGLAGLANLIILGHMLERLALTSYERFCEGVDACIPATKAHLLAPNHQALQMGYDYMGSNAILK